MNGNKPLPRPKNPLTDKQQKFAELIKENNTKPKTEQLPNYQLAQQAGYEGDKKTLSTTASVTIKRLKDKGIIASFEQQGITDDYIANKLEKLTISDFSCFTIVQKAGTRPLVLFAFTSAPFSTSTFTTLTCPCMAARCNGVYCM